MTPLQLTALSGILQNQGIEPNAKGILSIAKYEDIPTIKSLVTVIDRAQRLRYDPANVSNTIVSNAQLSISNAVITQVTSLGASTIPALGDSVPTATKIANIGNISFGNNLVGLSGYATYQAFQIAKPTDLGTFCQKFNQSVSYVKATNEIITTSQNTNFLGSTFAGMDSLTTGDFSRISTNLKAFGDDLKKLGSVIDFANLGEMGAPSALLKNLQVAGGIPPGVVEALVRQDFTEEILSSLRNPGFELPDALQKVAYTVMTQIGGDVLSQVLAVLNCTTPNITKMSDLLDPAKLFPTSATSLQVPVTSSTSAKIYINIDSVNTNLLQQLPAFYTRIVS